MQSIATAAQTGAIKNITAPQSIVPSSAMDQWVARKVGRYEGFLV